MSAAPWVCRPCLLRAIRPLRKRHVRFQTASASSDGLSSALLSRARTVAAEHEQLTQKLSDGFDARMAKKLGEIGPVVTALKKWDKATSSIEELKTLIHDPSTDAELRDLASDDIISTGEELHQASHSLKTSLVPKHPFESLPCLVELRPGAGGSEAAIFTGDLLRMYQALCSRLGHRTSVLKLESADGDNQVALTEAVLEIESEGAYGIFRCEAGVHRVQRVPATESKGRTHTSAVSVMILPSFPSNGGEDLLDVDNPESDYYVDPKEVRTEIMRARGAGGQHVNTTDSAVRLTHLPTMTSVSMQDYRSQPKNREKAWQLLRSRLAQMRREKREEEMVAMRRSVVGVAKMGRGDKVRTYNWGQQRVTDHRSGMTVHGLDDVMDGGQTLEKVMASVRTWLMERDVEALVAEDESKSK